MKHIQESIIGKKGSSPAIIPISGNIEFTYEVNRLSDPMCGWQATDSCAGWFLLKEPKKNIIIFWSPKSHYCPCKYIKDIGEYNLFENWFVVPNSLSSIRTAREVYDLISDDKWMGIYMRSAISDSVDLDMSSEIRDLIRKTIK